MLGFGPIYEWAEDTRGESEESDEEGDAAQADITSNVCEFPVPNAKSTADAVSQVNLDKGTVRFAPATIVVHARKDCMEPKASVTHKQSITVEVSLPAKKKGEAAKVGKANNSLEMRPKVCEAIGVLRGLATKLTVPTPPAPQAAAEFSKKSFSGTIEGPDGPIRLLKRTASEAQLEAALGNQELSLGRPSVRLGTKGVAHGLAKEGGSRTVDGNVWTVFRARMNPRRPKPISSETPMVLSSPKTCLCKRRRLQRWFASRGRCSKSMVSKQQRKACHS